MAADTASNFGTILGQVEVGAMAGEAQLGTAAGIASAGAFTAVSDLGVRMQDIRANAEAGFAAGQAQLMGLRGMAENTGIPISLLAHMMPIAGFRMAT